MTRRFCCCRARGLDHEAGCLQLAGYDRVGLGGCGQELLHKTLHLLHLMHTSYAKDPDKSALGDDSTMAVADGNQAIVAPSKRLRAASSTTEADEAATHWTSSWQLSTLARADVLERAPRSSDDDEKRQENDAGRRPL
jgi:hypothetical protein